MIEKKNEFYLCLDIETAPDIELGKIADGIDPKKENIVPEVPMKFSKYKDSLIKEKEEYFNNKYAKQSTRDQHMEKFLQTDFKSSYQEEIDKYYQKLKHLTLYAPFAMIKLARIISVDAGEREIIAYRNKNLDASVEKKILKEITGLLYKYVTGSSGVGTKILFTFNGKHYDLPLLIERASIYNLPAPYRWLERLTQNGDRFGHYDMIEFRPYKNTRVNKLSLSQNLAIRFGKGFAKAPIDFNKCTFEELDSYNLDEMLKFEYWVRQHNGMKVEPPDEFLKKLNKNKPKPETKKQIDIGIPS